MTEQSGIEMLKDLLKKIDLLSKRFDVIEQNTKVLLSRANSVAAQPVAVPPGLKPTTSGSSTAKKKEIIASKVMGKIKNNEGRAVSGVRVKIFNSNSHVIKETRTNRAGDWMCFLPPGKYGAEYFLEGMINANVNFIVTDKQRLIRVAQPKGG
jgi:hypothetical protein